MCRTNSGFNRSLLFPPDVLTSARLSHQATAEANNLAAVAAAKDQYYKNMEKVGSLRCKRTNDPHYQQFCLKSAVVLSFRLSGVRGRLALRVSRVPGGEASVFVKRGSSQVLLDQEDGRTRLL